MFNFSPRVPARRPSGIASTRPVNEIIDYLRLSTRVRGGLVAESSFPIAVARITGPADVGVKGRYAAKTLGIANYASTRDDLAESDVSTVAAETDDCEVWHLSEITGGAPLREGDVVIGILGPINTYTDPGVPTVLVNAGQSGGLFVVKVEKDGGTNGSATTAASYTYTVRSLDGETLGTAVPVALPRPNGMVTYQGGSDGYGLAFYDGETLKLLDAGEVPETDTCPA